MLLLNTNYISFLDEDECSTIADVCDVNAICENTPGSYNCTCQEGYAGDGKTCIGTMKDIE